MYYITTRQFQKPFQIKFEDVLFGNLNVNKMIGESDATGTVTRAVWNVPKEIIEKVDIQYLIEWLKSFNRINEKLFEADRESLYTHFKIPKKTGGWRKIDAPCDELQNALGTLAGFLENIAGVLYHTSAFAYVKERSIVKAVQKHANFKSNWFLKTDISGFFPNTTLEFTMNMLSKIFPLSEVMKDPEGKEALMKAISLGFLNDSLPQGTKLSPCLTNCIMIPIDHKLFGEFSKRKMVYTRYADDMHISAKENFPYKKMVQLITDTFREFDAPYVIKNEKVHYGSIKGRNWMLGLMLNGDHEITVGYRTKKYFKAELCNFILDTIHGNRWDLDDVQHLSGQISYYRMIEKDYFNKIIKRANEKWNVDTDQLIKSYLKVS